jgi:hypothetical protein
MSSEGNDGRAILMPHREVMERAERAITARNARRRRNAAAIRQIYAATVELQAAVTALEEEFVQLPGRIEAALRDATTRVAAELVARRNREG